MFSRGSDSYFWTSKNSYFFHFNPRKWKKGSQKKLCKKGSQNLISKKKMLLQTLIAVKNWTNQIWKLKKIRNKIPKISGILGKKRGKYEIYYILS